MSALRSMDDAHLSVALDDIFDNTPVESNQQDADTQRFFNAIGWSDELPEVVDESTFARAALAARHRDGRSFQMSFHTDSPSKKIPLDSMIATWANKNSQAYNKIINCHQVYYRKNAGTHRGARTIFAALFGYNVIRSDQAGGTYTVPNRSALTVQNRVIHRDDWYNKGQKW